MSFPLYMQANVLTSYYVGEGIKTLHKVSLIPGGSEVLVYTTLSGSIGILVPFSSREVSLLGVAFGEK